MRQDDRVKTIGLLGGMSWESTALYYRLLNETVRDRLGGLHSARCVLLSVDFADIERLQVAGEWEQAGRLLADDARALQAAGVDLLVLCTNTMHKVADALTAVLDVPLLHIGDITAAAVRAAGVHRVGFLGTGYTMAEPFLTDRLAEHGLQVRVPDPIDRAEVHRIIFEELCQGIVRDESRAAVLAVIERLVGIEEVQGVILGCTELELLIGPDDAGVPVFATTQLHVQAAVEAALAEDG
jgi:aspartate racemase